MVHQYSNGTGSLKYIITSEGRLLNTGTNAAPVWGWNFDLADHLGNVRVVFRRSSTGSPERLSHSNYLPFGMKMPSPYSSGSASNYLYNGKELQADGSLEWYDYGARMYDAAIGRWHTTDNYSEDFYEQSPYSYVSNNPINSIDPDGNFETKFGAWLWKTFNGGGEVLKDKGGEYFVSQKSDYKGEGYGTAVKRTFDWNGRSDGKDIAQEALIEAYRTQYDFSQRLNEAGIEYSYASIGEARFGMLSTASTVLLPNPILKSGTALINTEKVVFQFGKTENQVYHTFRHTDALGLNRSIVKSAIQSHLKTVLSKIVAGKPSNHIIEVGGKKIQYTVFKLSDNTLNIGRIHGVK